MKILHVVPTYWPAIRYGGPIYSVHGLCAALAQKGFSVTVFTTSVDGDKNSDVEHQQCYIKDGVNVFYFKSNYLRRLYYSRDLQVALKLRIRNFDIIHLHSIFLFPTNIAARLAKKYHVPYVLSPRGMLDTTLISNKSSWLKKSWLTLFEKKTIENAHLLHLTASRERDELNKFDYRFPKSVIIPNGVDESEIQSTPHRLSRDNFTVLYLGRLSWKKQIDKLIASLDYVNFEIKLVIAGNDEENCLDELKSQASQLKNVQNGKCEIVFTGAVNANQKSNLFAQSNVMVLPSLSENFGNTVIEAMAAGCPVIVTSEVGASEVVVNAQAGLITSGTPQNIAKQIAFIKSNPSKAQKMGENGIHQIKSNYKWSTISDAMISVYQGLIENNGKYSRH